MKLGSHEYCVFWKYNKLNKLEPNQCSSTVVTFTLYLEAKPHLLQKLQPAEGSRVDRQISVQNTYLIYSVEPKPDQPTHRLDEVQLPPLSKYKQRQTIQSIFQHAYIWETTL